VAGIHQKRVQTCGPIDVGSNHEELTRRARAVPGAALDGPLAAAGRTIFLGRRLRRMERATNTRFTFDTEGETVVGNLFLPEAGKPAVAWAKVPAAALAFDYRCFGERDGRPRQFENPDANSPIGG
jgi:hypothetical protein